MQYKNNKTSNLFYKFSTNLILVGEKCKEKEEKGIKEKGETKRKRN